MLKDTKYYWTKVGVAALASMGVCQHIAAQPQQGNLVEEVIVTASRLSSDIVDPARQVTVLDYKDIQLQQAGAGNAAELLAKVVPGIGQASQTLTNFGQTLRGRKMLVLVDGVPLNTNRNVSRDLYNIDTVHIKNIQVIRGGNAIYGSGATGGIIAITTKKGQKEFSADTQIAIDSSLDEYDTSVRLSQGLSGLLATASGDLDYSITAMHRQSGAYYDADGDRIAPEPSQGDMFDADITSIGTKLGFSYGAQRFQLMFNQLKADQNTDYGSDASVTALPPGSVPARARKGLELDQQNVIDNTVLSLDYIHEDLLNSHLHAQLYYRDYQTRFYPFDARRFSSWGNHIAQSYVSSETNGGRVTLQTPLSFISQDTTELLWGMDFMVEDTEMPVTTYDSASFDDSNGLVFVDTGDKTFMPLMTHESVAGFAQLRHRFNEALALDTGLRYEKIDVEFDDFITLSQQAQPDPQITSGGNTDYDALVWNVGVVYTLSANTELYGAYNEGFELPDIGLQVRYAPAGFNLADSDLEPIKTDNYELGWRGSWDRLDATAAVFYSTSDLGRVVSDNFGLSLSRNEERIQGVEASIDYIATDLLKVGATLTYLEGEEKPEGSSSYRDMNGFRIPPLKVTGYIDVSPSANQSYRLQALYSGSEDYRLNGNSSFGRREVGSYTTFDFIGNWLFGQSELKLSIENLFNKDYFPTYAQLLRNNNNTSHIPARGRWASLSFTYHW